MGLALGGLQVRLEHGVVDGGGDLADAAADLGLGLAAGDVGDGLLIALFLGALANGLVEGELLAGHENGAVDLLAGQLQIVRAVGDGGMSGVGLGNDVLEQGLAQLLGGELGMGGEDADPELLPGGKSLQCGGQGFPVKGVAVLALRHVAGGLLQLGLHRVLAVALVELVHVHGLGDPELVAHGGVQRGLGILGDQSKLPGIPDALVEILGGKAAADHAAADQQDLLGLHALGVGVAVLNGAQLVGGGREFGAVFRGKGVQPVPQGLFVPDQVVPGIQQIAVAPLLAHAGVQVGLQPLQVQTRAAVRLGQGQHQGLLAVPGLDGVGRQGQGQILVQDLVQLGKVPLQLGPGQALQGHGGRYRRGGGEGLGALGRLEYVHL